MFDVYVELEAGRSLYTGKIKQGGIFASLNPNRTTHRPSVHTVWLFDVDVYVELVEAGAYYRQGN